MFLSINTIEKKLLKRTRKGVTIFFPFIFDSYIRKIYIRKIFDRKGEIKYKNHYATGI